MTAINKEIEKYISEVGTHLFCLKKNKKEVLAEIREAVFEFAENNDVHSIDDIYKRFGTPEEIAKAYVADTEPQNIKKAISIRKMLFAAIVSVVLIFTVFMTCIFIDSHNDRNGTLHIEIEEGVTFIDMADVYAEKYDG